MAIGFIVSAVACLVTPPVGAAGQTTTGADGGTPASAASLDLEACRLPGPSPFAPGLYLSVGCAEGTARIRPDEVHRFTAGTFLGDYRAQEELAASAEWPASPVNENFFSMATAVVPVLMISGEMDHVTLRGRSLWRTSLCRHIGIPPLGHGPFDLDEWTNGDCFDRLAIDFFADPGAIDLDVSCVRTMVPPPFALPTIDERL